MSAGRFSAGPAVFSIISFYKNKRSLVSAEDSHFMAKKLTFLLGAAGLAAAAGGVLYLRSGMGAAEAVRKLSALRIAVELYRMEKGKPPQSFAETVRSGKLEGVPRLKLPGHFPSSEVRDVPALRVADTGGWAYVNAPGDRDFGLVYLDCSHRDERGRYWSEF